MVGQRPKFDLSLLAPNSTGDGAATAEEARNGARDIWVDGGWHETSIYDRLALPVGASIPGPAILEQPDATIFIEPDLAGKVDDFGNIVITHRQAE